MCEKGDSFSFKDIPATWDMNFLMGVWDYLHIRAISRIEPDWLTTPTYTVQRISQGEIVQDCGKGLTALDAWFSALFESIERSAAESFRLSSLEGSFLELKDGYRLCSPLEFFPQMNQAETLNLKWCAGSDLFTSENIFVPLDCVCFPYTSHFFPVTTTGLAANRTKTEAILHAIYEVIEHDTLSLHYYTGLPGREIKLGAEDAPLFDIFESLSQSGIKVSVQLLNNEVHIPTVLTTFDDIPQMPGVKVAGVGCHLDPFIAARRAITECSQSASFWYQRYQAGQMQEGQIYHPALYLGTSYSSRRRTVRLGDIENKSSGDVALDLNLVVESLREFASRLIVVDLTRDDFPFPCVKVVIPNFEDLLIDDNPTPRGRATIAKKAVEKYLSTVARSI